MKKLMLFLLSGFFLYFGNITINTRHQHVINTTAYLKNCEEAFLVLSLDDLEDIKPELIQYLDVLPIGDRFVRIQGSGEDIGNAYQDVHNYGFTYF